MVSTMAHAQAAGPAEERAVAPSLHLSAATTYLLLILFGAIPYVNTLFNGFVYDDNHQILRNSYLHSLKYLHQIFFSLAWSFQGSQGLTNYYRPLMTFEYLILYQLFGPLAYVFHLANVIMNVLVVGGAFWLTMRLYADRRMAWLAAALFAVHPIHTEAVAWVAAVSDLQMALSLVLAFGCFLQLERAQGARLWLLQAGMGIAFVFGLLSKEPAAMLPVLAMIFEHFYRRDRGETSWSTKLSRYGILWVLLGAYLLFRVRYLGAIVPVVQRPRLTWYETILTAIALAGQYIGKLFWPLVLSVSYPFRQSGHWSDPRVLVGLAIFAACLALFYLLWKRQHLLSFAMVWFFVMLAPVLNARWMASNVFTERYLYLPSLGFCWIVAWAALQLWDRSPAGARTLRAALALTGTLLFALALTRTIIRNTDWHDDLTLYSRTVRVQPDSDVIRVDLGAQYWNSGAHASAEREWREALRLAPNNVIALHNMALVMSEKKRYAEAEDLLKRAFALRPRYAEAHLALGDVYVETGRPALAEAEFRTAIQLYPLSTECRNHLAQLFLEQGRVGEAETQFRASVDSIPTLEAYDGLGDIYFDRGLRPQAEENYREAIRFYPYDHHAHFRLAGIYADWGRTQDAIREYKAGLETDPRNVQAQAALGKLQSGAASPASSSTEQ